MSTLLDLLTSAAFGGALLLIILEANATAVETQGQYAGDMAVQEMLTSVVQGFEGEFRNMGFGVADTAASILSADSSTITFRTCLDGTGTHVDTVCYWVGSTNEMSATQNELDRPLYRKINHSAREIIGAVTTFSLKYIDYNKQILPSPVASTSLRNIQTIEITVEVENPYAQYRMQGTVGAGERNALYSSSLWQQTRLASMNLRR
jgi:hypothetical protein